METWELGLRERDAALKAYERSGTLENEPELGLIVRRYDDGREDLVIACIGDEATTTGLTNTFIEAIVGQAPGSKEATLVNLPLSTWLHLLANAEKFKAGTEAILSGYEKQEKEG